MEILSNNHHQYLLCDHQLPPTLPQLIEHMMSWEFHAKKIVFPLSCCYSKFLCQTAVLRSIAFQRCILRRGLHFVSQNEAFLPKNASKTAFLMDTKQDQVTLERAGTPISNVFTCSLKSFGHSLSNEVLGSSLAPLI